MPTNFELKQLKPKLDIAKRPENRVHELTDYISNVSRVCHFGPNREYRKNEAAPNKILWYAIQSAIYFHPIN